MAERKTRLAVRYAGVEKQIFSVNEKSNGGLTIAGKAPILLPCDPIYVTRFKISVHMSPSSTPPGRTVHTYLEHISGKRTNAYAFYPVGADPFIYVVTQKLLGKLENSLYNLRVKASDRIVKIAGFDPQTNIMLMFCYVVEKGLRLPAMYGLKRTYITFSKFDLVVYTTFVSGLPTPNLPVDSWVATRPMIVDGQVQPGEETSAEPLPIELVDLHCRLSTQRLTEAFYNAASAFHLSTRSFLPYPPPENWNLMLGPHPFDDNDLTYGVHGRFVSSDNPQDTLQSWSNFLQFEYVENESDVNEQVEKFRRQVIPFSGVAEADMVAAAGGDLADFVRRSVGIGSLE